MIGGLMGGGSVSVSMNTFVYALIDNCSTTSLPTTTSATATALVPLQAGHTQAAHRPHHTNLVANTAAPLKVSTATERPRLLNNTAATVVSSNMEVLKANSVGLVVSSTASSTDRASTVLRLDTVASLNSTGALDSLRDQVAMAHKVSIIGL